MAAKCRNEMSQRLNEAFAHLRVTEDIRSVSAFALALGYDRTYVSNAINGKTADFPKGIFTRLCDAYPGVFDLNYLMTGVGSLLLGEPSADGADARLRDLQERVAEQEELIATQRLLIETLRDRLRSLGVEYVAPPLPTSRTSRPYTRPSGTTFSLHAAEPGAEEPCAEKASAKPGTQAPPVSPQQNDERDN